MNIEELYSIFLAHPVVCTDTRNIKPGSLFFALKGDRFNANAFAAAALKAGAAYAVIDEPEYRTGDRYLLVDDVLTALQDLARLHRKARTIPFVGITGTNGKTTTKELLASVLQTKFRVHATKGNLNNHIGVPLTLLSMPPDTEIAVIEMGANHQGEIAFLSGIAHPTHGLITNVGKAHLEGFGGFEGVKKGKGELYSFLAQSGGTIFINRTSADLGEMLATSGASKVIGYHGVDGLVKGGLTATDPFLEAEWQEGNSEERHTVKTNLTGTYNLDNILATACIGRHFGLSPEEVNAGISSYQPTNNRSQLLETGRNRLICDYYNANPSSMVVALDNLESLSAEKKAIVLGDMFELGEEAESEHRAILEKAFETNAQRRIFIGKEFAKLAGEYQCSEFYTDTEEAIRALKNSPLKGFTVLLKGSRSMRLETLVELL